ncbi:transposase [Streptomyces xinghaiensis]|nr:transposase [Streptomyces xinghaiensis]
MTTSDRPPSGSMCVNCGLVAHADHVGALNVKHRAGLVLCAGA